jgi:hypothetical protein
MAKLSKLLKTDVMAMGDISALAELLQGYGRGKDTVLAHITPKEAALLKSRGGRGSRNPQTGLLEFEGGDEAFSYTDFGAAPAAETGGGAPVPAAAPVDTSAGGAGLTSKLPAEGYALAPADTSGGDLGGGFTYTPGASEQGVRVSPQQAAAFAPVQVPQGPTPLGLTAGPESTDLTSQYGTQAPSPEKSLLAGLSPDKLRLALGAGLGGLGVLQARRAASQAQAAKRDIAALGEPYQQQGQALIAAAQRGELTPANQQALQAASAQLQQGIAQRGGVGVAQAAQTLANLQNNMLQQQYTYGLQVAQIGDQYAQRAVQAGLQQDKELQALMQGLAMSFGSFAGSRPNTPATQ